ncbi:MAG TPA: AAA family ATPase [Polyangiaceae bacterium]|jgi:predicted ATPase
MVFSFGEYELDEERFELRGSGAKVPVQPKVLDVIFYLVRNRERVVLKRELLDAVWADVVVSEASVSRVIMEARKAIGDELQQVLVTVRGRGFRFAGEVVERERASTPRATIPAVDASFVDRVALTSAVEARLEEAFAGRGSLVWLSGEAGIGKTRTADEIARRARARGATVLVAHAHEKPDAPPFWLWTQIFRAYTSVHGGPATQQLGESIAPLMVGEPALSSSAEFSAFDALTQFLVAAARKQPLLLVLDDVHWADQGSLRLLQFFARDIRGSAILIVGTYRDTALTGDEHARVLGGLLRESASLSIPLRGLTLDEIPRFVEVTSGSPPSPAFAKALLERTGGNPLYLHQILKTDWAERALTETAHELASSMDLQQGLIESISRHVDAVSEGAREMLNVAAVLGREFELAKLALVSGLGQQDLLDRLDEAARARVLIKSKDGTYRFAHMLVREVLYKKMSSADRAARHCLVAEKLLAHYSDSIDPHVAELAHHFSRALPGGDPARTIELSIRAARQETALGSHRAAARHWEQAAQAFTLVRGDDARRVQVQLGLAQSRLRAGQDAGAREAFLDAVILARTFTRPDALAEAALGFASLAGDAATQRRAILDEARSALAAGSGDDVARLKARVEAVLAGAPDA